MKNRNALTLGIVGLLGIAGAQANAAVITPTGVTGGDAFVGLGFGPEELINGDGLSGVGDILTQTHVTVTNNNAVGYWLTNDTGTDLDLIFTLPSASDIDKAYIWQYTRTGTNGWNLRGVDTFDISFSTDGVSFGPTTSLSLNVGQQGNPTDEGVQTLNFAAQSGVTHVKFSNIENFPTADAFTALGEVRFGQVPEPGSLALLGLGGLCLLRRRRSQA